jgi:hypothetical protein
VFRIKFTNSNENPIFIQVDPWAGLYVLSKGEEIEIAAVCETDHSSFDVEEYNDTRILVLADTHEYFVVRDGQLVHWSEYPTNISSQS